MAQRAATKEESLYKMMRHIEIDLYRDWVAHLRNQLTEFGCEIGAISDDEKVIHTFLNLQKRLISRIPREILKSKEFSCPQNLQQGLSNVEGIIRQGGYLTPYLSRSIKKPDYNDPLLNHWGIHHIHLGSGIEPDGFIKRTTRMLFCRFDNKKAYFINVLPHKDSWTRQGMIRVLHENWPESIRNFRMNGVFGLEHPITDDDVKILRNKNINVPIEVKPGIVYGLMGGCVSASGISADVVTQADYCIEQLEAMQRYIIDRIEEIAASAKKKGVDLPNNSQFRAAFQDEEVFAVEINCNLAVPLGKL
uniref:Uncharacterized protein n=1 Tax=Candidatus Kentrum sp. FM TaxID=2126340 RepID=A0A450SB74_9GAMM|nr:MAG: hypothetical protein BECKFM1743A_GA0114220_1002710 [Candidatus Kentron sp. FM]VFJ49463.1 MAG: hypothetical protein BECKFM1743C_GA0114222_1007110 [Candidatus Kentron sp. FM]VFK13537.1 MAG: hypothetical protein BECKFM1743B_GA0114221_102844 [Candidatus Kentron sp. FM]